MNLNERENLQSSDTESLKQSCSLTQKNTDFQELRNVVEQCVEVNNQKEISLFADADSLKERTFLGNSNIPKNMGEGACNYCCDSDKKNEGHECHCTKLQPLIHTLQEGALEKFDPSSSAELMMDGNEIPVNVHSEIKKGPNQFEETNNSIGKYTESDSSKFTEATELSKHSKTSTFNFKLNSEFSDDKIHFDSNVFELFNGSGQYGEGCLKTFIKHELKLLQTTRLDFKRLFFRILAYNEDERKPSHERKFPLCKVQSFNKTLNMMLFGKAQFEQGAVHYKRLEDFVNGSLPSKFFGESLQNSYEYIFGATRHADMNYLSLIKSFLKQQETEQSVILELTGEKHRSKHFKANKSNANSISSKNNRIKIDVSGKAGKIKNKKKKYLKDQTRNDFCDNTKKNVADDSSFKFEFDSPSSPFSPCLGDTQTKSEIEISQEVKVKDVATLCSNIEIEGLPAGNDSRDETSELSSITLLPPSELIDITAASNQFGELKFTIKANTSIPDSVISASNSKFVDENKISSYSKPNSMNVESLKSHLKNKLVESDCDIRDFFIQSDTEYLKSYISDSLELLKTTRFKVHRLFHRFIAFKKDESNPISERKIELYKIQHLNKTLNMMLFGKAHFKEGADHHRILEAFVNGSISSKSLRGSLYNSYKYIFSATRHANVNYMYFIQLLRKTHRVIPAEIENSEKINTTKQLKNSKTKARSKNKSKKIKRKKERNSGGPHTAKCAEESVQPKKPKVKTLKAVLKSRFNKKTSESNFDLQEFFIESETDVLINYVKNDLDLLQNATFNVRKLFHQLINYKRNEKTLNNIGLYKKQILNVTLNMMIFGRAHLEDGGNHYSTLVDFVKGVTPSNCTRESLYCSYKYIFSDTRHDHLNYVTLIELLMKKLDKTAPNRWKI